MKPWVPVGIVQSPYSKKSWIRHLVPAPSTIVFTVLIVAGLLWAQSAGALPLAAPNAQSLSTGAIPYQGRLADASGTPVDALVGVIFRLYAAPSGGVPLWEEQWTGPNSVAVSDGLFNVMLGSLNPISHAIITGNDTLYLGITVGSDDEMVPRVQLGTVPYAVQALTIPDVSVTTAKLADGAVTVTKLSSDIDLGPPAGVIVMWSGALDAFPDGWALCDGTNGTPDLRDRFIVGAGSAYAVGATGGANQVTLTVAQIPAHGHGYTDQYTNGGRTDGSSAWDATNDKNPAYSTANKTTANTGGGQAHENRPPYFSLAYIMKLPGSSIFCGWLRDLHKKSR